ncbi:alanine--tRNA ligase [Candidatus Gottesmanbacteria bacterium]|nr:alanine--tRNA ligase [Candidatus Gottesmanbacteria bacterium]
MTHKEVRKKFISFYKGKRHVEIPSASLVPENDPTTLFTSSGMQPLVPYLLGEKHPSGTRIVNSQKCFRAQDIDEVGDNRHTTFFEMLGNWSLGDYFKENQLPWFFEFLTDELHLDPKRLYISVFEGNEFVPKDNESIKIWKELFSQVGIEAKEGERIFSYGVDKNWWSRSGTPDKMPPGEPGGPDSEVFYDFGIERKFHENSPWKNKPCHPNCECGRFLEIGNSVFMEYQKQQNGSFKELPQKNVDFGGGLERLVAATNDNPDMFQIDLFSTAIKTLEAITKTPSNYKIHPRPYRIISDHLRAAIFLVDSGVEPSNKLHGYVLRRLIRRAMIQARELGMMGDEWLSNAIPEFISQYSQIYPSVTKNTPEINQVITAEVDKFRKTIDRGLREFEKLKDNQLTGSTAFNLYQSYGFPLEIIKELYLQKGVTLNELEFSEAQKTHANLSRKVTSRLFKGGLVDQSEAVVKLHTATHLLQQALREVLGSHVRQKGSNITAERLRFDFTHPEKISNETIEKIEHLVNKKIDKNLTVSVEIVPLNKAIEEGALTVPGTTYPEQVKVYSIGNFSKEVCGGPHVDFTATIGSFKIVKEEGISQGVRRIYAKVSSDHVNTRKNHAQ